MAQDLVPAIAEGLMLVIAIGSAVVARNSKKEVDKRRQDDESVLRRVLRLEDRATKAEADLELSKQHHAECEAKRVEDRTKIDQLEGSVNAYKEMATMQKEVPGPMIDFIKDIAKANDQSVKTELSEVKVILHTIGATLENHLKSSDATKPS